jgi:hypothetical protein
LSKKHKKSPQLEKLLFETECAGTLAAMNKLASDISLYLPFLHGRGKPYSLLSGWLNQN